MTNQKFYDIDGQKFDRVTTILGATTSTIGLNRWYADMQRKADADLVDSLEIRSLKIPVSEEPQSEWIGIPVVTEQEVKSLVSKIRSESGKTYAAELYRDSRADQGTTVHNAIETFLKDQVVAWKDEEEEQRQKFEQFLKWWKDSPMVKIQTERPIHSKTLRVAGTLDLSGEYKGKHAIVDFKTGRSLMYDSRLQLSAYALLDMEMNGKYPIEYWEHFLTDNQVPLNLDWPECFLLHLESDRFEFLKVEDTQEYCQEFLFRLASFRIRERMSKKKL